MVDALDWVLRLVSALNSFVLRIGRTISWMALAAMVAVILCQIFFRYVLNNALPWPDEAARFLMLWMTGLIAPLAYRHGGFVAIQTVPEMLPPTAFRIFTIFLLLVMALVLVTAIRLGWAHTMGFGGNFNSSSLRIPLDMFGLESIRVKLRYMYASLLVCIGLLLMVNVELVLRNVLEILRPGGTEKLPADPAVLAME